MFIKSVSRLAFSVSTIGLLSAQGAFAAVTPEEVWANWKAQAASTAYEFKTSAERREGNSLIIEGAVMEMNRDGETGRLDYGKIVFTDRGDGTVSIELGDAVPMTMSSAETGPMNGKMSWTGLSMIASGSPEAMRHDMTAEQIEISFDVAGEPEKDMPGMTLIFGGDGLSGHFVTQGLTVDNMDMDFKMTALDVSMASSDSEEFTFDISAENVAFAGAVSAIGVMAQYPDPDKFAEALRAGLSMKMRMTAGASSSGLFVKDEAGVTSFDSGAESATLDMQFDTSGMSYAVSALGIDMNISGDTMPLPEVNVTMAEGSFGFRMPWASSEEQQDFSVLTRLVDLALPDDIWGMLDPMQSLPREPATLIVDLVGKVKVLGDIFAEPAQDESFPGELHALEVKEMQLKLVGADLTGAGAFTFDNSDLETFGGMPRPTGAIDMKLVGGNSLLDKAIAMGLLPEDEAMGYRMMLALFARPGEGEDTLVSKIEVTPEGAVLANGQRIQ
jgi:hypothetical protein